MSELAIAFVLLHGLHETNARTCSVSDIERRPDKTLTMTELAAHKGLNAKRSYSVTDFPHDMVELASDKRGGREKRTRACTVTSLLQKIEAIERLATPQASVAPSALDRDGSDAEGREAPLT